MGWSVGQGVHKAPSNEDCSKTGKQRNCGRYEGTSSRSKACSSFVTAHIVNKLCHNDYTVTVLTLYQQTLSKLVRNAEGHSNVI